MCSNIGEPMCSNIGEPMCSNFKTRHIRSRCVLKVCSRLLQPCSRYAQGMLKVVRQGCVPKAPQGMCAKVACSSLLKVCVLKVVCSRFCPHQRLCPQPTRVHAPIKGRPTSAPTPYSAAELSVATYRELQIDWRFRLMHSD